MLYVYDVLNLCNGKLLNGFENEVINKCFINSKEVSDGGCFFGINGKRVNGSLFYKEALDNGAKICILEKITDINLKGFLDRTIIIVDDVLLCMQKLAEYKRSLFKGKVIGITGSVGKTTTRCMIKSVLESKYKVLSNTGNQNGQTGLPLTILNLTDEDVMVLEMGMSMPGEMHKLSSIAKPDISIITNVCLSHIENFSSKEDILNEKLSIIDGVEEGILFINNDDELLNKVDLNNIEIKSYGIKNKSDYMLSNIMIDDDITFDFNDIKDICISAPYYYLYNVLIACVIGKLFNISNDAIKNGVMEFKNEPHRLEKIKLSNNITLIDDCYNASYESIKTALDYLSRFNKRKILVIADVLELGNKSKEIHKKIGEMILNYDIDKVIVIGKYSKYIYKVLKSKYKKNNLIYFKDEVLLRSYIKDCLKENDTILIKGSNGMRLINIINYLKNNCVNYT